MAPSQRAAWPALVAAALVGSIGSIAGAAAQPVAEVAALDTEAEAERRSAQDLLAGLLERTRALESTGTAAAAAALTGLRDGQEAYRIGEWRRAEALWRRALDALDTALDAARLSRRDDALSEAYIALRDGRESDAKTHFERAGTLDADAAADGLVALALRRELAELDALGRRLALARKNEDWRGAERASRAALAIDAGLLFAQRGLEQARGRARLDARMQELLADALNTPHMRRLALEALEAARALGEDAGARLATQRAELAGKLEAMSRPISVIFVSDKLTRVTLLRVAQLGRFERTSLSLLPGEYTALGQRAGYRDVRRTFTVQPGVSPAPVSVRCEEAI